MFLKHTLQSLITGQHDRVALGREEVERCDNRPRFHEATAGARGRSHGRRPGAASQGSLQRE